MTQQLHFWIFIQRKQKQQMFARMQRKGNPHTLLVGLQIGIAAMENSMEVSQNKLKMDMLFDPAVALLGIYPNKAKTMIHKDLFTAA